MVTRAVTQRQSKSTVQQWLQRAGLGLGATTLALIGSSFQLASPTPGGLPVIVPLSAHAQGALTEEEVYSYAAAVLQMDGPRNQAYTEIKDLLMSVNQDVNSVDMTCTQTRSLNNLPRSVRQQVRTLVVNYCNQAQDIVENNGLTVSRFNEITEIHRQDPDVAAQIRTALIKIQQQSADSGEPTQP